MENLKKLISSTPTQMIFTSSWFEQNGISSKSVFDHKKYGWIESLGRGAYIKKGVVPDFLAGVAAIQTQTTYRMHLGGMYVLDQYHGIRHYLRNDIKPQIFTVERNLLPSWFSDTFRNTYSLKSTSFIPDDIGKEEREYNGLKIKISSLERALLEMLYVDDVSTKEAYQIFELITVLKPNLMNKLLQECKSIKVKRLFLFLSSQVGYAWYNKLNKGEIDLGSGVREIDKAGSFNKEFNIIVAKVAGV